ncbi:hypothetical protein B0I35DRAFT_452044 [Stachybotrys elegans]|uniref:Uncharacterized protein n=1 Tax=Stachybotrys elegans TaxID=80388 RepID=A0A8K0WPB3_9HYPO|nr:hypothetical protein B0I35DRAFT_452044 [Stachybotrys elegans]
MSLAGKVAIVTGAARGIGAGIALALAKQGAKVAITFATSSSKPRADVVVSQIASYGTIGVAIQADFHNDTAPAEIVTKTLKGLGVDHIDILVNNAGVASTGPVEEVTHKVYDDVFAINTRAVFFMTQAPMTQTSVYSASKVAIEAFTRVMAAEFGPKYGVTVTAVNPGPIAMDMYLNATDEIKRVMEGFAAETLAEKRMGTPEDIADIVGFLASDASRWITGNVVTANGGMVTI